MVLGVHLHQAWQARMAPTARTVAYAALAVPRRRQHPTPRQLSRQCAAGHVVRQAALVHLPRTASGIIRLQAGRARCPRRWPLRRRGGTRCRRRRRRRQSHCHHRCRRPHRAAAPCQRLRQLVPLVAVPPLWQPPASSTQQHRWGVVPARVQVPALEATTAVTVKQMSLSRSNVFGFSLNSIFGPVV